MIQSLQKLPHNALLADKLLEWYQKVKRPLPWRTTRSAYHVWLSEVMCQQTQVATVIPYYERFLKRCPTIADLARISDEELFGLWQGLGYYSRAKRLKEAAGLIMSQYHGFFPDSYQAILALPGIGPYTAGAIASIAYNQPYPAVDGNVFRVISRLYHLEEDISKTRTRRLFEERIMMIQPEQAGDFNQAVMELGATLCRPTKPVCQECPLVEECLAYQTGHQEALPVKAIKKRPILERLAAGFIHADGYLLFVKRPDKGLLANQWGLPMVELEPNKSLRGDKSAIDKEMNTGLLVSSKGNQSRRQEVKKSLEKQLGLKRFGLALDNGKVGGQAKHVFSHRIWQMTAYHYQLIRPKELEAVKWVVESEVPNFPLAVAFRKIIEAGADD